MQVLASRVPVLDQDGDRVLVDGTPVSGSSWRRLMMARIVSSIGLPASSATAAESWTAVNSLLPNRAASAVLSGTSYGTRPR